MESRAIKRYIGSSPRKMRLVVDLIRNKSVEESIAILKFSKKHPAYEVEKTVRSAYSNLVNAHDTGRLKQDEVFVKEAFVDVGPTMKRMLPAPQGRAFRIRKRSAHLTVIVTYNETNTEEKKIKRDGAKVKEEKVIMEETPDVETKEVVETPEVKTKEVAETPEVETKKDMQKKPVKKAKTKTPTDKDEKKTVKKSEPRAKKTEEDKSENENQ